MARIALLLGSRAESGDGYVPRINLAERKSQQRAEAKKLLAAQNVAPTIPSGVGFISRLLRERSRLSGLRRSLCSSAELRPAHRAAT